MKQARLLVPFLAALLLAGCLPAPATTEGQAIDSLYRIAMSMAAVVAALVWGLLTFAVLRYRRRRHDHTDLPPQTRGNRVLETLWTAGPLATIFVLFGLTLVTLNTVGAAAPSNSVALNVEAFRWGWRMEYPQNGSVIEGQVDNGPTAVLPVGRTVVVTLTSADVIHAFFVPQFLYKRDAIPGQTNVFRLTIDAPGVYAGQCAEFCGIYHSRMPFTIKAVPEADFDAWLSAQTAAPSVSP